VLRVTSSRIYRAPGKPLSGFQDACGRRYLGVFDTCAIFAKVGCVTGVTGWWLIVTGYVTAVTGWWLFCDIKYIYKGDEK